MATQTPDEPWIPFAFLPLHKPVGPTSHDMVYRLRRLLPRKTKVGHMGTLDPFASGVLIMGIGKATRFMEAVHELPKRYRAHLRPGVSTDTFDNQGEVDREAPLPEDLSQAKLNGIAAQFVGKQAQMPPAFSAKKIAGKKAYELARAKKEVVLKPSEITIHELSLGIYDKATLTMDVTCSTGTYVRALGRDIALALQTVGHLTMLERTQIGDVHVEACVDPETLSSELLAQVCVSVDAVLPQIPCLELPHDALEMFKNGRPLPQNKQWPVLFIGKCIDQTGAIEALYRCVWDAEASALLPKGLCWERP